MHKNQPMIITLDGPAGVGKSTLAKDLAGYLNIAYLDTGAMFRALALHLGPGSWDWSEHRLQAALQDIRFSLSGDGPETGLEVNGVPVGPEIRTEGVGLWASHLGQRLEVRCFLKASQQEIGNQYSLVAEGRDMGSEVFPRAGCKIFLDAAPEERARRRCLQLQEAGHTPDEAALAHDLRQRDQQDRTRAIAPLRPADDAHIVDTTALNLQEVQQVLRGIIHRSLPGINPPPVRPE
jgi:cytidylate kinase